MNAMVVAAVVVVMTQEGNYLVKLHKSLHALHDRTVLFYHEDGGRRFLRNADSDIPYHTASYL